MATELFRRLTRGFLYLLIGSIAAGAALAILTVLGGLSGWREVSILLSCVVLAATSVAGLACGAAVTRTWWWPLPATGIVLSALSGILLLFRIWAPFSGSVSWQLTWIITILAASFAHASVLSLAPLRHGSRTIQWLAYAMIMLVAMIAISIVLAPQVDETVFRYFAIAAIVDAALSLTVPILWFLTRSGGETEDEPDIAAIDAELAGLRTRIAELEELRESLDESNWMKA